MGQSEVGVCLHRETTDDRVSSIPGKPLAKESGGSWWGSGCSGSPQDSVPLGGNFEGWGSAGRTPEETGRCTERSGLCCTFAKTRGFVQSRQGIKRTGHHFPDLAQSEDEQL